ncbi:MAG: hypothetical protein OFPI_41070 [Osedax symbiont Rs2]|nr:MAG: hypothetical protein OFPI_41070 [Osedax symbiont Rs2]
MKINDSSRSLYSVQRELNNSLGRAGRGAANWLDDAPLYISTKNSGSGEFAQVIEIALLDASQNVIFHSQIRPSVAIDKDAEQYHAINLSSLQGRPVWPDVIDRLKNLLRGRKVIIFDAIYETRILKQSCQAYALDIEWIDALSVNCAMYLSANAYGSDNRYGTTSITHALQKAQVGQITSQSGAVASCYALIKLVTTIADYTRGRREMLDKLNLKIAV